MEMNARVSEKLSYDFPCWRWLAGDTHTHRNKVNIKTRPAAAILTHIKLNPAGRNKSWRITVGTRLRQTKGLWWCKTLEPGTRSSLIGGMRARAYYSPTILHESSRQVKRCSAVLYSWLKGLHTRDRPVSRVWIYTCALWCRPTAWICASACRKRNRPLLYM